MHTCYFDSFSESANLEQRGPTDVMYYKMEQCNDDYLLSIGCVICGNLEIRATCGELAQVTVYIDH